MTVNDFVVFAQANGQASAKFFTRFDGADIYVAISKMAGKIRGRLTFMKEKDHQIVFLNREETSAVLRSLPDDDSLQFLEGRQPGDVQSMEKIEDLTEAEFRKLAEEKGWDKEDIDSFIITEKKYVADLEKAGLNASLEENLAFEYETLIKDGPIQDESYPI